MFTPLNMLQYGAQGETRTLTLLAPASKTGVSTIPPPGQNLVLSNGNDPLSLAYQANALPLSYERMVPRHGFEPQTFAL